MKDYSKNMELQKTSKPSRKANSGNSPAIRMLTDSEIDSLRREFQEAGRKAEAYFKERFANLPKQTSSKQQKPQK